jgi:uncharacterized protein
MDRTILIVPGFRGSGPGHWQTWIEAQEPSARRVTGIDWDAPILATWAGQIQREIDRDSGAVLLVAHSFGCLAAVVAAADRPEKVAGAMLVAPADPDRISALGLQSDEATPTRPRGLGAWLPREPMAFPSLVVASSNDPWMKLMTAAYWADQWGSRFVEMGPVGHINVDSGFGPWPEGLRLLRSMQEASVDFPLGTIGERRAGRRGAGGVLATLRRGTRWALAIEATSGG